MDPITTGALIVGGSSLASSLIGGGLSAYGASVGAKQSYTKSKRLMNYQNKLNKKNLLESKALLRQAGYNPILYASNGGNALPSVSQASAPVPDYASGFSQMGNAFDNAAAAGINFAKGMADVKLTNAEAEGATTAKDVKLAEEKRNAELHALEKERIQSEIDLNRANALGHGSKGGSTGIWPSTLKGLGKYFPALWNSAFLRFFLKGHYQNGKDFVDKDGWLGDVTGMFTGRRQGMTELLENIFKHKPLVPHFTSARQAQTWASIKKTYDSPAFQLGQKRVQLARHIRRMIDPDER